MSNITYDDFSAVEVRVGTILRVAEFPEARRPAYKLYLDFGPGVGEKQSSAQITERYTPAQLVGRQVMAVVNFPPKQVGKFMSEVLVLGVADSDGQITLVTPDHQAPNGARLH